MNPIAYPLIGGMLIGLSGLVLLAFTGRIFGVSGTVGGLTFARKGDREWRVIFLFGLLFAGFFAQFYQQQAFSFDIDRSFLAIVVAGILVGFGSRLANGCTSGHGVCGISRLSGRSLIATALFIAAGATVAILIRIVAGGRI